MTEEIQLLGLVFLGSIAGLLGAVIVLFSGNWAKRLNLYSVPFAAGVLLTVSLLGLAPEAIHLGEGSMGIDVVFMLILGAFLAAYIFENFLFGIHHHEEVKYRIDYKSAVPLVIFGDSIHNLIDGVAIAASYMVNPGLGLVTAISTFLHEVPHEIADFGILLKAGWDKKNIVLVNVLSALTTFAGAGIVLWITNSDEVISVLLAIAAGLFLYLGASDFLPEVHEVSKNPWKSVLALFVGVGLMLLVFSTVPHSHGEEIDEDGHNHGLADQEMEGILHEDDDH